MLLAVAGLDDNAINEKTRMLAEGNWSAFPPEQRVAFAFARKLSEAPASIRGDDWQRLKEHFGPVRSFDVVWWACRCHYMTRVADAFQLPLERDNVFQSVPAPKTGIQSP